MMPHSCRCLIVIVVGICLTEGLKGQSIRSEGAVIPKCTADLSLALGIKDRLAPEQAARVLYPVLIQFSEEPDLEKLPSTRCRQLSMGDYVAAYLRREEISRISSETDVIRIGLGGAAFTETEAVQNRLWPPYRVIRSQDTSGTKVVLGVIDYNATTLAILNTESAARTLLQREFIFQPGTAGSVSVHGANVARIGAQYGPNAALALYDSNLEELDILIGIETINDFAESLGVPAVINLSASTQDGSHDGQSLWEKALGDYSKGNCLIVVSAGNTSRGDVHLAFSAESADDDGTIELALKSLEEMTGVEVMVCLWFSGEGPSRCQITGPTGESFQVLPGRQGFVLGDDEFIGAVFVEEAYGVNLLIGFKSSAPPTAGHYRQIRLSFDAITEAPAWHCNGWIRCTPRGRVFNDVYGTDTGNINSLACAKRVVAVGSVFKQNGNIQHQKKISTTRDGRIKPDVFVVTRKPTSYSAAMIAGLLAEEIHVNGIMEIEKMIQELEKRYDQIVLPRTLAENQ